MKLGSNLVKNTDHFQNCGSESLKNMGFPFRHYLEKHLFLLAYLLLLSAILMLAWGTVPFMISPWVIVPPPPGWLSSFARLIFYRDYIF
jgi:hypothetical protein